MLGDFGDHLEVRKATKAKNRRLGREIGKSKTIVSDVGDSVRNTSVRMAHALSGSEGAKLEVGQLRDVERLFYLEDERKPHKKSWRIWKIAKLWQI